MKDARREEDDIVLSIRRRPTPSMERTLLFYWVLLGGNLWNVFLG